MEERGQAALLNATHGADSDSEQPPMDVEITTQMTLRRAREVGGVTSLPVAASTQEYSSELVQRGEQPEEVPTGTLPPPRAAKGKRRRRTEAGTKSPFMRFLRCQCFRKATPGAPAGAAVVQSREYDADEHRLSLKQLAERFQTDIDADNPQRSGGLSVEEAAKRLKVYGKNILSPPKQVPEIIKFLLQFTNYLLVMLIVAGGLAFLGWALNPSDTSNVILGGVLFVLVFITGCINYSAERSTADVLASIKSLLPSKTKVVRSGREVTIGAEDLVIGDLVHLTIGNRIPADLRLIFVQDFKVDLSSLTGESDAVECFVEKRSVMPTEARNLVFNSSLVISGDAWGIVHRTGDDTMIGSIAGLAGSTAQGKTSMEVEIEHVVLFITIFAIITAAAFFAIALARGLGFTFAIVYGLVLVLVANVPEGLPTTVVTVLTLTAQRMAEHQIFIKRTQIIEMLGAATVICTDKTGTLTMNKMTVENIWCNRAFSSAGKVKQVTGPPPLAAGLEKPSTVVAAMTIGRQMSSLRDGTMVIHSLLTANQAGTLGRRRTWKRPRVPFLMPGEAAKLLPPDMTGDIAPELIEDKGEKRTIDLSTGAALSSVSPQGTISLPPSRLAAEVYGSPFPAEAAGAGILVPATTTTRRLLHERLGGGVGGGIEAIPEEEGGPEAEPLQPMQTADNLALAGGPEEGGGPTETAGATDNTATTSTSAGLVTGGPPQSTTQDAGHSAATAAPPPPTAAPHTHVGHAAAILPSPQPQSQLALTTSAKKPTKATAAAPPSSPTALRQASIRELMSFKGEASWERSNAFTRLVIIAVVCNRARFSENAAEAETVGGDASPPPPQPTTELLTHPPSDTRDAAAGWWARTWSRIVACCSPSPVAATATHEVRVPPGHRHDDVTTVNVPPPRRSALGPQPRDDAVASDRRRAPGAPAAAASAAGRRKVKKGVAESAYAVKFSGDSRVVLGDASDAALLRYVDGLVSAAFVRSAYSILYEIPFNSVAKYAIAIVADPEAPQTHIVFMKGAPERILERCSHALQDGKEVPADDAGFQSDFQAAYERFGFLGERVLGFAYRAFPAQSVSTYKSEGAKAFPTDGLVFCGLISLLDPPKPDVEEAIEICKRAYVRVTMVTGDHPLTAESIARKVGIITGVTAREVAVEDGVAEADIPISDERVTSVVIAGYALPGLSDAQWDTLLAKEEVVFARTSPQQKLQIVEHYQRLGQIVAVTGDGTNDAPALKKAHIGVSMGSVNASDVAREAADIVLLDDNFASITRAIEMGRLVFDNLKKTVAYTLTHAIPELVPIGIALAFFIPLAFPGLLILTVDLITEQGNAISLAYEPAESNIMERPPRDLKKDRMVDKRIIIYSYGIIGVIETLACLLSFFTVFESYGIPGSVLWNSSPPFFLPGAPTLVHNGVIFTEADQIAILYEAHAAYYLTLVLSQCFHVFCCKTRFVSLPVHGAMTNPKTMYGVLVAIFAAVMFIYLEFLHTLFQTADLGGYWWLPAFATGIIIYAYTETSKWLTRRNPTGWWARNVQW